MPPRLVTALLVRNEAAPDRYLARVLARCAEFSDEVLVMDDGSTDDTAQVAKTAGCNVVTRAGAGFWGDTEAPARRDLWEWASERADDGWVLVCDADMLLHGDPRPLCASWASAAWAWPLVDLWDSETTFRVDGPWGHGPVTPRPWLFRPRFAEFAQVPHDFTPIWHDSRIHTGHAPLNFLAPARPCHVAPSDIFWLHLGWMTRAHRERKATQYAGVADTMTDFERAHAATILD